MNPICCSALQIRNATHNIMVGAVCGRRLCDAYAGCDKLQLWLMLEQWVGGSGCKECKTPRACSA